MKILLLSLLPAIALASGAVELTKETFQSALSGKNGTSITVTLAVSAVFVDSLKTIVHTHSSLCQILSTLVRTL